MTPFKISKSFSPNRGRVLKIERQRIAHLGYAIIRENTSVSSIRSPRYSKIKTCNGIGQRQSDQRASRNRPAQPPNKETSKSERLGGSGSECAQLLHKADQLRLSVYVQLIHGRFYLIPYCMNACLTLFRNIPNAQAFRNQTRNLCFCQRK